MSDRYQNVVCDRTEPLFSIYAKISNLEPHMGKDLEMTKFMTKLTNLARFSSSSAEKNIKKDKTTTHILSVIDQRLLVHIISKSGKMETYRRKYRTIEREL